MRNKKGDCSNVVKLFPELTKRKSGNPWKDCFERTYLLGFMYPFVYRLRIKVPSLQIAAGFGAWIIEASGLEDEVIKCYFHDTHVIGFSVIIDKQEPTYPWSPDMVGKNWSSEEDQDEDQDQDQDQEFRFEDHFGEDHWKVDVHDLSGVKMPVSVRVDVFRLA